MKTKQLILVLAVMLGSFISHAQIGIGTKSPHPSARLEVNSPSSDKGFLPPRLTTDQRNNITSPAEGLTIYNTDNKCLEFYTNQNFWISGCDGTIVSGPCDGLLPSLVFKGLTYKPVESDEKCWLDRNLGASKIATASNDAASFGDLYQWGREAEGHESRTSSTFDGTTTRPSTITSSGAWDGLFITIPLNTNREDWVTAQTDNAWNTGTNASPIKTATDPCPNGYRLPTDTELDQERASWSTNDASGALASPLKLPAPGRRSFNTGGIGLDGNRGHYWSSSVKSSDSGYLQFRTTTNSGNTFFTSRANGFSVRCIRD